MSNLRGSVQSLVGTIVTDVIAILKTGSPDAYPADEVRALITIEGDNPAIAELSPEMLRARLKLNSTACWRKHWDDDELALNAKNLAQEIAAEHLAVAPDELHMPEDMPAALKSETVLHYAVKLILQEAGQLRVLGDEIWAEAQSSWWMHRRNWRLDEQLLNLSNIELEKRLGLTSPDLICTAMHGDGALAYASLPFLSATCWNARTVWPAPLDFWQSSSAPAVSDQLPCRV